MRNNVRRALIETVRIRTRITIRRCGRPSRSPSISVINMHAITMIRIIGTRIGICYITNIRRGMIASFRICSRINIKINSRSRWSYSYVYVSSLP